MNTASNPIVVITGGGTGGHLFPALAVAEAARALRPDLDLLFIGRDAERDRQEVEKRGIRFMGLRLMGLKRRMSLSNIQALWRFAMGVARSAMELKKHTSGVVFGVGGYVSAPAMIAGTLLRWPVAMHEQNTVPGLVNRTLARWCRKVYITFESSRAHFAKSECEHSGFPLRSEIVDAAVSVVAPREMGDPNLLLMGGSQGAKKMVETASRGFALMKENGVAFNATVQTGERNFEAAQNLPWPDGIRLVPFIDDMASAYKTCDLVISRAGAGSLSEIALWGRPSVLVPYPYASQNHQERNAADWVENGAAVMVQEIDLDAETFARTVSSLLQDHARRERMGKSAQSLAKRNASMQIAQELVAMIEGSI